LLTFLFASFLDLPVFLASFFAALLALLTDFLTFLDDKTLALKDFFALLAITLASLFAFLTETLPLVL